MRQDVYMARRKRRSFTDEQKADAVRLARELGRVARAASDLDLTESALRS
jgi:transposase